MTKQELFEKMSILLVKFHSEYRTRKTLDFSKEPEQLEWIRDIYRHIMNQPHLQVEMSCGSCIVGILDIFVSYFGREFPKYQAG